MSGPARPIVWLASYPKSGNSWARAFLTAYRTGGPVSLAALDGGPFTQERALFDDILGIASSDLDRCALDRLRPEFLRRLAEELTVPSFAKLHSAFIRTDAGAPVFSRDTARGAVYFVRNPLDVAVSYAHHDGKTVDDIIARMADPDAMLHGWPDRIAPQLPERLKSWSGHVESWLDQRELPLLLLRYEDMIADPEACFARLLDFAGVDVDPARLSAAVANSAFDRLRGDEAVSGFPEKSPVAPDFFRAGKAGGWREALDTAQIGRIVGDHRDCMARLGYLDEVLAFLGTR